MQTTLKCTVPICTAGCTSRNVHCQTTRLGLGRTLKSLGFTRNTSLIAKASTQTELRQFPRWDDIWRDLTTTYGLESIPPQDAAAMLEDGRAVLVDVRLAADHEQASPQGSVSVPLFYIIEITKAGSMGTFIKGLAYMANGVTPTDTNPAFLEDLKKAAGDKAVIFACEAGGTLQPNVNFKTGKVSRSLKAAWRALNGGAVPADKAYHLEGGVFGWYNAGLPMSGEYDDSAVWKTPNAVPPVKNT